MLVPQMDLQRGLAILLQFPPWLCLLFPNDNTKPFMALTSPHLHLNWGSASETKWTIKQFANITQPLLVLFSHNRVLFPIHLCETWTSFPLVLSEICTTNLPFSSLYLSLHCMYSSICFSEPLFILYLPCAAGAGVSMNYLANGKPSKRFGRGRSMRGLFIPLTSSPQSPLGLAVSFDQSLCPLKIALSFLALVIASSLQFFKSKVIVSVFLAPGYSTISCQFHIL